MNNHENHYLTIIKDSEGNPQPLDGQHRLAVIAAGKGN